MFPLFHTFSPLITSPHKLFLSLVSLSHILMLLYFSHLSFLAHSFPPLPYTSHILLASHYTGPSPPHTHSHTLCFSTSVLFLPLILILILPHILILAPCLSSPPYAPSHSPTSLLPTVLFPMLLYILLLLFSTQFSSFLR